MTLLELHTALSHLLTDGTDPGTNVVFDGTEIENEYAKVTLRGVSDVEGELLVELAPEDYKS